VQQRQRELERKTILDSIACGKLTLMDAAKRMRVSYRQAKRINKRYRKKGDIGLQHGNRGKKPHNAYLESHKQEILEIYCKKYMEFGPTFASEKLMEDDGRQVNAETLKLWLKQEDLWTRKRKHNVYRERRDRRSSFGDLLQIDGSIHQWFAGNDEKSCLLNIVDDATGVTLAVLDTGETTAVLLTAFKKWVDTYGIPKSVYVDLKSVYVSPKRLKEKYDDDLLIQEGLSVFQQVCAELGVEIIRAYSPQAKGRVERKHGVFQDRFVKDLKLYNIKTIAHANKYLEDKFLNKINEKFAQAPESMIDSHRDKSTHGDLDQIFCWRYKRQLKNDWTIQLQREYYQVEKPNDGSLAPKTNIIIKRYLDNSMRFWHEGKELIYRALARKPAPPSQTKKYHKTKGSCDTVLRSRNSRKNKHHSPWNRFNPNWLKKAS
jgi:transposase